MSVRQVRRQGSATHAESKVDHLRERQVSELLVQHRRADDSFCQLALSLAKDECGELTGKGEEDKLRGDHLFTLESHQRAIEVFHLQDTGDCQHEDQDPGDPPLERAQEDCAEQTRERFGGEDGVAPKKSANADVDRNVLASVPLRAGEEDEEDGQGKVERCVDDKGDLSDSKDESIGIELTSGGLLE